MIPISLKKIIQCLDTKNKRLKEFNKNIGNFPGDILGLEQL